MGGFCSCFHVPDEQQDADTSDTCFCPPCLIQNFKNKHLNQYLQSRHRNEITSPNQQQESHSNPGLVLNNAAAAAGSGAHDGASFRQHSGEPELVEQSEDVGANTKSRHGLRILVSPNKEQIVSKSSAVVLSFQHTFPSSVDREEECPTCLEEYTHENPKIIAKCGHHYHLSCIYEWMERNSNCPVCGKVMRFNE
ncbi:hypothetical protein C2S51_033611 [Perilla frutescens var. frutescens]|nr:hypothetical protein C2S51_033611 [Perilla frutescens var. frutescens]